MTTNGWSPGTYVIDVLITIHIPYVGPFYPVEHDGLSANGFESPYGRVHATWH
jgi:hypothetical protein